MDFWECRLAMREILLCCPLMNILIENAESLQYLTASGEWSNNPGAGRSFGATNAAVQAARREPIHRFNIVCYIAQTKQFINLDHGRGKGSEAIAG